MIQIIFASRLEKNAEAFNQMLDGTGLLLVPLDAKNSRGKVVVPVETVET